MQITSDKLAMQIISDELAMQITSDELAMQFSLSPWQYSRAGESCKFRVEVLVFSFCCLNRMMEVFIVSERDSHWVKKMISKQLFMSRMYTVVDRSRVSLKN